MEIRDFRPEDRQEYLDMSVDFYSGDASLFDVDMKKFEDTFELGVKGSPLMRGLTITEGDEIIGYALLAFYWSCEAGGFTVQAEELYFKPQMRGKGCGHKFFQWSAGKTLPSGSMPTQPKGKTVVQPFRI